MLDDKEPGAVGAANSDADPAASVNLRAIINPDPDDKIIYRLRPNLDAMFQGVPLKTNSCGMRGPEVTPGKAPGVYRIALLGDSFTFGWGVEQSQIFAQVLEDNLNKLANTKTKVEVLNFGVPGYSTFQEVNSFINYGSEFEPDAVLVFFIENDFALPFYVRDVYNPGQVIQSSSFLRLLRSAADAEMQEHQTALRGLDPNTSLKQLADFTNKNSMRLFLAINPKAGWDKLLQKLWITRSRREIQILDMSDQMAHSIEVRGIDKKDLTLPTDPHPSALKHRMLGDLMTPYFMEAVS
jgi:hypothetical protein